MARGTPTPAKAQKKRWTAKGTPAFATVPCWCLFEKRWVAWGTPIPATTPIGHTRKDEQPGVHQRLLLSHADLLTKKQRNNNDKKQMARSTPTPTTTLLKLKRKDQQPRVQQQQLAAFKNEE